MIKLFVLLFTNPIRLISLLTCDNLRRLWFYIVTMQFSLLFERIRHIYKNTPDSRFKPSLYFPKDSSAHIIFPRFEKPLVSIIIPVFNQWGSTRSCLLSILENCGDIPYEVLVADDASSDETRNINLFASNIKIIVNKTNKGFILNCNEAATHARGEYLIFLNNDTIVQPDWLTPLIDLMERDNSIGMAGSKLVYPDGCLQEAGGIIWKDGTGNNYGRSDLPGLPEYNYLKEVDYVSGASIIVRKSVWFEIGGFDNRFQPAYYEDTDLAFEIRKRGYKVVYQPLSTVIHFEGLSHGKDIYSGVKSYQLSNQSKFCLKWQKTLEQDHLHRDNNIFKARDRSAKKKTILFIDHYVPFFDQDAGSKSTFQYLQLMVEMGYNIKFIGDDFVNHQPYTMKLQQMGIEVLYGPWYQINWKNWIIQHGKHIDYVYISRPHIAKKYLNFIKKNTSCKIIYCGHDLIFLREARHYIVEGKKAFCKASQKWKELELNIIQNADVSYFFSTFELEELNKIIPSCTIHVIPLFIFDDSDFNYMNLENFTSRSGLLFVGGFKHDPNIDAIRWFVREIFPLVKAKLPSIELIVAGSNPPPTITQLSGNGVVITGKLSDEQLIKQYRSRRIVIAPLRYGAGVKGKIIEAMQYGVPTVTTSIGAEGIYNADKGLLISDEAHSFANLIISAYTNPMVWNTLSKEGLNIIMQSFSKTAARRLLEIDMPPY